MTLPARAPAHQEGRRFPRLSVSIKPIRSLHYPADHFEFGSPIETRIIDLSAAGLSLRSRGRRVGRSDRIQVVFRIADETFEAIGVVVWTSVDRGHQLIGLQFLGLTDAIHYGLRQLVERELLLERRLRERPPARMNFLRRLTTMFWWARGAKLLRLLPSIRGGGEDARRARALDRIVGYGNAGDLAGAGSPEGLLSHLLSGPAGGAPQPGSDGHAHRASR